MSDSNNRALFYQTIKKILYLIRNILFFTCLIIIIVVLVFNYFDSPMGNGNLKKTITIEKDTSIYDLSSKLSSENYIDNSLFFNAYVFLSKSHDIVLAGSYEITNGMRCRDIINTLLKNQFNVESVTIDPGLNLYEVGIILSDKRIVDYKSFIESCHKKSLLRKYSIPSNSLEGFLFPDRYLFRVNMETEEVIDMMVSNFFKHFNPTSEDIMKNLTEINLSYFQWVIFASLIEEETKANSERNMITAVLYNRIKEGWKIESEPALRYFVLLNNYDNNPSFDLEKHLSDDTQYNTFKYVGLPPTPITNPSNLSLEIALKPPKKNYYFMKLRDQNYHYFADTKENLQAQINFVPSPSTSSEESEMKENNN